MSIRVSVVAATLLAGLFGSVTAAAAREITFEERVKAQHAIEAVLWKHRTWPKDNLSPKPRLSSVMTDETVRARVRDHLQKSDAAEAVWKRPITGAQLQAELERMAAHTRDARVLRELFDALGNDPALIAETLARQQLVDRLLHTWYARDDRLHDATRKRAEEALAGCANVTCMSAMDGAYEEVTWRLASKRAPAGGPPENRAEIALDQDEWKSSLATLARTVGGTTANLKARIVSDLIESDSAMYVVAVLSKSPDQVTFGRVTWKKVPFDSWWTDYRRNVSEVVNTASSDHSMPMIRSNDCIPGQWNSSADPPDPRYSHTAVWTGTEMIVWGGNLDTGPHVKSGARYSPATDTWQPTTGEGAPEPRNTHTAVWTGTEMLVWGGTSTYGGGGRYDPTTDSWAPINIVGEPSPRGGHTAIWTGTEMIVWGGGAGGGVNTGGRYDPASNRWTATSTGAGVPSARIGHTSVWTGSEMIIWGGGPGGRYSPVTNTWTTMSPSAASGTAVWSGTEMIVWGGGPGGRYDPMTNTWRTMAPSAFSGPKVWTGSEMIVWRGGAGGRYNPVTDAWTAMSRKDVPTSRAGHSAVWTGSEMIVWGGTYLPDGGRYDPLKDTWVAMSPGDGPSPREYHTAVWTGMEMVVFGGARGVIRFDDGGRYLPATDSWIATSSGLHSPGPRARHAAVWTGTEVIVWGGGADAGYNVGARYSPTSDTWSSVKQTSEPPDRVFPTAVWTGTEMIVWGGGSQPTNTGGRYDPLQDLWRATTVGGDVPQPRAKHSAVWTGTEMIVWGGDQGGDSWITTGGRYRPQTNRWSATTTDDAPSTSYHTAIWTGDEMIVCCTSNPTLEATSYGPEHDTWVRTAAWSGGAQTRNRHSAVWTGHEMIIWGGGAANSSAYDSGNRYEATTNDWAPTSLETAPSRRFRHTAVWTGRQMIVWGGMGPMSTGGTYCVCPSGGAYYRDADGDGFGDHALPIDTCASAVPAGYVADSTDCYDSEPAINPDAQDVCNGVDDDCSGAWDDDSEGVDSDADGVRNACDNCRFASNSTQDDLDLDRLGDACDNCFFDYNPPQSDFDDDGEGDLCDLNDGLIYLYPADANYMVWQPEAGQKSWNSYRGGLDALKTTGVYTQSPGTTRGAARVCGLTDPWVFDAWVPDVGDPVFYLTTGVVGGVEGSLGSTSAGLPRLNANPCP